MILKIFTLTHVVISLVALVSGLVVLFGLLAARASERWTAVFLATTVATSATGFFFPVSRFLPSHAVGIISLIILGVVIYARYSRQLQGPWRTIYVLGAVLALYLNVFVAVVQAFLKIPALHALAPTQVEAPFQVTQMVVLATFVALAIAAALRFRARPAHAL
jgi:hypothetical protein